MSEIKHTHENKNPIKQGEQNDNTKPPLLSDQDIITLCKKFFEIEVEHFRELNSYDDRNYNVHTNLGKEFVLKVTNSHDTKQKNLLEGQNEMILFLQQQNFNVPCPIKNVNGQFVIRIPLALENAANSEKLYAIRLFSYIPGIILYSVPIDKNLLIDCGQYLARINLALKTFDNEVIRKRNSLWSLNNIPKLHEYYSYIKEEQKKELVAKCIKEFENSILSSIDSLKHSYLHGDFNDQNIIIHKNDDNSKYQIYGLIDFGDICYGPLIYDIAIFLSYVVLLETDFDPILLSPKYVLQGYRRFISLTNEDVRMILICARARLSQSLTLGAYSHSYQQNNEYLLITAKKGWQILERLCSISTDELIEKWIKE